MHAKSIVFLASAGLAVAANMHRHGHEHLHKKDLKIETDIETVTDWVTVTVYDPPAPTSTSVATTTVQLSSSLEALDASFSSSSSTQTRRTRSRKTSSSSSSVSLTSVPVSASVQTSAAAVEPTTAATPAPAPPSSTIPTPETTLITATKPTDPDTVPTTAAAAPATTSVEQLPAPAATTAVAVVEPSTAAATAATTATATPVATAAPAAAPGGKKRGLAYNDPKLLSGFLGTDSKVSWAYGWNQVQDFDSSLGIEFVPMLWGPKPDFLPTWDTNAKKAIANGATALLSFNEPDNAGQCNISPATAVDAHIQYMNPYKDQVRIGSPAITNSGAEGQGISWLTEFLDICAGRCAVDFAAVHWYSNNGDDFLSHLKDVYNATGLPVWVTEFAPIGDEVGDYSQWVANVTASIDTDPQYSFVERYSYFMVSEGSLVSGGQPSALGKSFAFSG